MRQWFRNAMRGTGGAEFEFRRLPTSGSDSIDARRRQEFADQGFEWWKTECGPQASRVVYSFRRPRGRRRG